MVVDFPEIKELDINPLVVSGDKVIALDARIIIDADVVKNGSNEFSHLIISPIPYQIYSALALSRRQVGFTQAD